MKKKFVKLCFLLVCAVIVLDLTGGKLAQPERHTKGQDPFIGFHLVPERLNTVTGEDGDQWTQVGNPDRSQWVEYGTETMEIGGFDKVEFPREVLIGTYNEQTRRYEFPGMEGFNCFLAIRSEESGERYIVEDDFESEFSLLRKPEETVFGQSRRGNVIYLNTFSRTLSPSFRIGYMVLPERLLPMYREKLGFYSCTVPSLDQYVLAEYIKRGYFEKRLNHIRRKMKQKKSLQH